MRIDLTTTTLVDSLRPAVIQPVRDSRHSDTIDWRAVEVATATPWQQPIILNWQTSADKGGVHHRSGRYDISELSHPAFPAYILTGYGLDLMSGSVAYLKGFAAHHHDRMVRRQRWSHLGPLRALGNHCEPPLWVGGYNSVLGD